MRSLFTAALVLATARALAALDATPEAAGLEFFEKNIRPVLAAKCYKCHSAEAEKVKGGLLLDTREGIRAGGDSGHAVVPGNLKESLLIAAIRYADKDTRMPPEKSGGKLPDEVIRNFEAWVKMGAPDPREGAAPVAKKKPDPAQAKEFWAFQIPKAAPAPEVKDTAWPRTDIDRFILAALEAQKLRPVADAEPRALIRRLYFDLIGLPPTPEEVEAFVHETQSPITDHHSPVAAVVDRLLASPQFGERWGRHWLDVARFAESTGKERNYTFPEAWRYRDWVIAAFNADKPYDQFIREQIAGDLLPAKDDAQRNAQLIATGFLALGPKGLNEKNREQFRMDVIDEQIDATSRAVLGLTVACARCHDHKFDPIPQRDYYALAGIFHSSETHFGTETNGKGKNGTPLLPLARGAGAPARESLPDASSGAADRQTGRLPDIADGASAPHTGNAAPGIDQRLNRLAAKNPAKAARIANLKPAQKQRLAERVAQKGGPQAKRKAAAKSPAASVPADGKELCMGVVEGRPADTRVLVRGELDQPGESVPRGFVNVLTNGLTPAISQGESGRRELAAWLTAPTNPLTARVMVNRAWATLFGQGLVRTADNFGATGEKPSHPELLDALAVQFARPKDAEGGMGWSVKQLVRSIVLSRTYQLSSAHDSAANETDPDNLLLWRASPRRLDAEAIRDAILATSGQLDLAPPKTSFVATVGEGYVGKGIKPEAFSDYESNHRSVYLPIVRDCVPDALDIFDFAEPSLVVAARDVTNVPAQALYLMNDSFVRAQSAALAKRILASPLDYPQRIKLAYQLALSRSPSDAELVRANQYLLNEARGLIPTKNNDKTSAAEQSWSTFCQALFACAEFRYLR